MEEKILIKSEVDTKLKNKIRAIIGLCFTLAVILFYSAVAQATAFVKRYGGVFNIFDYNTTYFSIFFILLGIVFAVVYLAISKNELTVYENLLMGAYSMKDQSGFKNDIDAIYTRFPRLAERRNQIAGTLSGGEQQMLAMGRAIMSHPKLLMLDEPSMGLSPLLVDQVFEIIKDINRDGTTILLVEQNAGKSLAISDRAYVLENGKIALSGTGKELMESEDIKKAYLGG